jgi:beta-galactosidase
VKIETDVQPSACLKGLPSLARVGLEATLDKGLFNMTYYGRGEVESYPDRKTGTEMGVWKTTVLDNEFDYIVPGENGNKTDCRLAAFQDTNGRGVCFVADPDGASLNIGATLNSQLELHRALHTCDVGGKKNGQAPIYAHVDHRIMGVGGDVSWFPAVYPDYLVKANEAFNYTIWMVPLSEGDDPLLLAKNVQEST